MSDKKNSAQKYSAAKNRIFFLDLIISVGVLAALQASGVAVRLRSGVAAFADNFFLVTAIYATFLGAIIYLTGLPLGFYKSHVLEHRFGLSNQGLAGWVKDECKKAAIAYIIFLIFAELLYLFLREFPETWWMWMAGAWILFGIIFAKLVPVLIIPLFFKYTELENQTLKTRLIRLAGSCGIRILNVFKIDLSAKTKKANAALTGLGNTRRILLSDTLLNNYTDGEIEVVMAHELAHHKFRHIWKTLIFGGAFTVIGFYAIAAMLDSLTGPLGIMSIHDIAGFPLILLGLTILGILALPIQNWYSRSLEKKADYFAVKTTGLAEDFISCMNKLASQNLADVAPSRFIEIMRYDHPPISRRIEMVRNIIKTEEVKNEK